MPCALAALAFFAPRLVIVLLCLFSDFMGHAYTTVMWPVLGFFFMPFTTLVYACVFNTHHALSGYYFGAVLLAALVDLGAVGGGYTTRRFSLFRR
jgi:hypothetical protein